MGGCAGSGNQGIDKNKGANFIKPEVKPFVPGSQNNDFEGYSGVDGDGADDKAATAGGAGGEPGTGYDPNMLT